MSKNREHPQGWGCRVLANPPFKGAIDASTGDQIRFLRAVEDIFLSSRRLSESDLYDAPQLTAFGRNAVDRLFSPVQVGELVRLTEELAI